MIAPVTIDGSRSVSLLQFELNECPLFEVERRRTIDSHRTDEYRAATMSLIFAYSPSSRHCATRLTQSRSHAAQKNSSNMR